MSILQRYINIVTTTTLSVLLMASICIFLPATANALGLKVTPLKYEEQLELGSSKSGFVDVSNPNDVAITVTTSVRGFRQIDLDGNLEFYENEQLSEGIVISVDRFDLGPREAARIFFQIDSNKLSEGGVYGVLFFETTAQKASPASSSIETGSRVGTLLILENGDQGVEEGKIENLNIGFWQLGSGIEGTVLYHNQKSELAVGFRPELSSQVMWGEQRDIETGLVLPGVTREFILELKGNYVGLLPVTVTDATTGAETARWVFAMTGAWRLVAPFLTLALLASFGLYLYYVRRR